jgi:hypothetical protein
MACNTIYDFITGVRVQLPTISRAEEAAEDDGRHGLRAILSPNEAARTLLSDHLRLLAEMQRPAIGH